MTVMQVLILGVGNAFTTRHFGSSALIHTAAGHSVLIDCPDLIHRTLREAGETADWQTDPLEIHDVILTHLHGDHSNGLESFAFWHRIAREKGILTHKPRLWATRQVGDRVWQKLAPAMDGPFMDQTKSELAEFFDLRELDPTHPATIAGLEVECRFTGHPIPTVGLRITENHTTLGWSGDTPFEQAHVDWLAESDLIVHETNSGASHTPIEKLNELPDEIRAKIHLIHMPDDFDPSCTDMHPLTEGEVLTVGVRAAV